MSDLGTSPFTPCRHFGDCGGCALQNLSEREMRRTKRLQIVDALAHQGLSDIVVGEVLAVPPRSRRRASLKVQRSGESVAIGFHATGSHRIVDMRECLVLTPRIVAVLPLLREAMAEILRDGEKAELRLTEVENGIDAAFRWQRKTTPRLVADMALWAGRLGFVRVTAGSDVLVLLDASFIRFGEAVVKLPPEAFLQPTREGEAMLVAQASEMLDGAKEIADLFSGCGTFALPLAKRSRVHAVEFDPAMAGAAAEAARNVSGLKPVTVERRDLFRRPLTGGELDRFDAVLLDPPRLGALAQAKALAASRVKRIAYVSCDAHSFARDARVLVDGGYRPGTVTPVDQFLWSEHIELVAPFERRRG